MQPRRNRLVEILGDLGAFADLESVLIDQDTDIAIVVDFDLSTEALGQISSLCERLYVQFKILPNFFRIFAR